MSKKIRINIYDLAAFLNEHAKMVLHEDYNNPMLVEFIKHYSEKLQEVSFNGYDEVNNEWYEPTMSDSIKAIRLMFNLSNTSNIVFPDIEIFTPGGMDKVLESYKTSPIASRKERRRTKVNALIMMEKFLRAKMEPKFPSIVRYMKKGDRKKYWNEIKDGKWYYKAKEE